MKPTRLHHLAGDRPKAPRSPAARSPAAPTERKLPAIRVGVAGGVTAMLCCVGPTVLALAAIVGAGTAYSWAERLYGGYAWWFRLAGLIMIGGLFATMLRRRRRCSLRGARSQRRAITITLGAGIVTYAVLYAATTGAGRLAS